MFIIKILQYTCKAARILCKAAAHSSFRSDHCGSFQSNSKNTMTNAGKALRCLGSQLRFKMPLGRYHS